MIKQRGHLLRRETTILQGKHLGFGNILLAPGGPECGRRQTCAIAAIRAIDGEQQLAVRKKLRDLVVPLIAQALRDAFIDGRSLFGPLS